MPVLHVDLDQFIAAVEVRRRPELAGLPVVVGGRGDPTERGVVATASYAARERGVGSGMPLRIAARKCPDAVFLPVDKEAYDAASAEVMATLRAQEWDGRPVAVQVLGWDEAFVGRGPSVVEGAPASSVVEVRGAPGSSVVEVRGAPGSSVVEVRGAPAPSVVEVRGAPAPSLETTVAAPETPEEVAARLRTAILEATGLSCAVGIGDNVLQAKLATGFAKQRISGAAAPERTPEAVVGTSGGGIYRISDATWFEEMGARPVRALWGIGAKTGARLEALGLSTVHDLATADPAVLAGAFGPNTGPWLRRLGRGIAATEVDSTPWVPRGHGREETFQTDLDDCAEVEEQTRRIARLVAADIQAEGRPAQRVEIKIRFRPFFTVTRSHKLAAATADADVLAEEAVALLDRVEKDRAVRLIGVRLEMVPPEGGY